MGSQNSLSNSLKGNNKKEKNKNNNKENNTLSIDYNDSSSYKGITTDTTSLNGSSLTSNSLSEKNETDKTNEIKIPTLFEWKEGGTNIIITGSFCGWSHRFAMAFNQKTNNYELILYLPKGEYQFKFIIDNVWKCSSYYETKTDNNNNTNNYIDNSKLLIEKNKEKENLKTTDALPNNNLIDKNNRVKNNHNNNALINLNEEMRKKYGFHHPKKEQLNEEPPNLPQSFVNLINFSNYSSFKEKYLYNILKNNLIRETFKSVKIPSHVYLNHLFMNSKDSKNYIKINATLRIRSKFASIIYCHPKGKIN